MDSKPSLMGTQVSDRNLERPSRSLPRKVACLRQRDSCISGGFIFQRSIWALKQGLSTHVNEHHQGHGFRWFHHQGSSHYDLAWERHCRNKEGLRDQVFEGSSSVCLWCVINLALYWLFSMSTHLIWSETCIWPFCPPVKPPLTLVLSSPSTFKEVLLSGLQTEHRMELWICSLYP